MVLETKGGPNLTEGENFTDGQDFYAAGDAIGEYGGDIVAVPLSSKMVKSLKLSFNGV